MSGNDTLPRDGGLTYPRSPLESLVPVVGDNHGLDGFPKTGMWHLEGSVSPVAGLPKCKACERYAALRTVGSIGASMSRDGLLSSNSTASGRANSARWSSVHPGSCRRGTKQVLSMFAETLRSLTRSNKDRTPFPQGRYNVGGSESWRFCGPRSLQRIVSCRIPDIPSNGTGSRSGDVGIAPRASRLPSARPLLARQLRIVIGYDRQRRDGGIASQPTRHATVLTTVLIVCPPKEPTCI